MASNPRRRSAVAEPSRSFSWSLTGPEGAVKTNLGPARRCVGLSGSSAYCASRPMEQPSAERRRGNHRVIAMNPPVSRRAGTGGEMSRRPSSARKTRIPHVHGPGLDRIFLIIQVFTTFLAARPSPALFGSVRRPPRRVLRRSQPPVASVSRPKLTANTLFPAERGYGPARPLLASVNLGKIGKIRKQTSDRRDYRAGSSDSSNR